MSSLTTKYNTKLRAAQQRNKELRAELAKLQVHVCCLNKLSPPAIGTLVIKYHH